MCKSGKQHRSCSYAVCTMDDASYFLVIRLGPKTSECKKNVTVVSTVTGCDVTNCATTSHGFKAVSDWRRVPRCTGKNSTKSTLAHSHASIVRLVRLTTCSACDSSLSHVSIVPVAR